LATANQLSALNPLVTDVVRQTIVEDILRTGVTNACWPTWERIFRDHLGTKPSADSILSLGARLSEIFSSTRGAGVRGQSEVSGAGTAWEALVCYYLNLCLVGTSSVVFRKRSQVPVVIRDALTVSYRSVPANTESDMVAVTFPEDDPYLALPLAGRERPGERLDFIAAKRFGEVAVTVVQCKTNWNENAQIPMLWDMVYNTKDFRDSRIEVGIKNRNLSELKWFAYSFVTVPTNRLELYKPTTLAVRRVHELSGGNYWGRPTKSGVARSMQEIFAGARIGPGDGKNVRRSLEAAAGFLGTAYRYFLL
jgi:hypothetical protein